MEELTSILFKVSHGDISSSCPAWYRNQLRMFKRRLLSKYFSKTC